MNDNETSARKISSHGYCVLDQVYTSEECAQMRGILNDHWQAAGCPRIEGRGFGIHPLLLKVPDIAPYFDRNRIIGTLETVLTDKVRLARAGGRITDENCSETLVQWHNHYHWDKKSILTRERIERVLAVVYPDGTSDEVGNLIGMPRQLNDQMDLFGNEYADWPSQVVLRVPPGSVVLFDSAFWHTARRGTSTGRRYVFGGHFQGWTTSKHHPDDHDVDTQEVARFKTDSTTLRILLTGFLINEDTPLITHNHGNL